MPGCGLIFVQPKVPLHTFDHARDSFVGHFSIRLAEPYSPKLPVNIKA